MKKASIFIGLSLVIASVFAFKPSINNTPTVNQEQGVYLFVESTPQGEYQYLGDVKQGVSWSGSGQFGDVKKKLLSKCKKDFPQANGLIFHLVDGGVDHADAVILK